MLTKEQKELVSKIKQNLVNGSEQSRNVPFAKNDKLTIKLADDMLTTHEASGNISAWNGVKTQNGVEVSTSQLLRRNNGLPLSGITVAERFESFCNWLSEAENATRTITISDLRTREIMNNGEKSLQRVLIFSAN